MKKILKYYILSWAISFGLFHLITFLSPDRAFGYYKFTGAFWVGYGLIAAAYLGHLACTLIALSAKNVQKVFYRVPMARISYAGLIVMTVIGVITMAIPNLPIWFGVIGCALVMAAYVVAVLKAGAAAELVAGIDEKTAARTGFIKDLTVRAQSLAGQMPCDGTKKVYEAFRYCDPTDSEALAEADQRLTEAFRALTDAVNAGDAELVNATAGEVIRFVSDRNAACKMSK